MVQVVRGHGGCCTDASKAPILQAKFTNLEDNNVVKKSSLSTMGMLKEDITIKTIIL